MADPTPGDTSEFQQTLRMQIALYEGDLDGLRRDGGEPSEISAFEMIVAELRRLQFEDLAEVARCMVRRPAVQA